MKPAFVILLALLVSMPSWARIGTSIAIGTAVVGGVALSAGVRIAREKNCIRGAKSAGLNPDGQLTLDLAKPLSRRDEMNYIWFEMCKSPDDCVSLTTRDQGSWIPAADENLQVAVISNHDLGCDIWTAKQEGDEYTSLKISAWHSKGSLSFEHPNEIGAINVPLSAISADGSFAKNLELGDIRFELQEVPNSEQAPKAEPSAEKQGSFATSQ